MGKMVATNKTVGELIHSLRKEDVLACLATTYKGKGEDPEGYSQMWDTLVTLQPKAGDLSCLIDKVEHGIDVSGIKEGEDEHYAIEFVDWREWLFMPIVLSEETSGLSEIEQMTHILYEIAWGGYTQEIQQDTFTEILDRKEEVDKMIEEDKEKFN